MSDFGVVSIEDYNFLQETKKSIANGSIVPVKVTVSKINETLTKVYIGGLLTLDIRLEGGSYVIYHSILEYGDGFETTEDAINFIKTSMSIEGE